MRNSHTSARLIYLVGFYPIPKWKTSPSLNPGDFCFEQPPTNNALPDAEWFRCWHRWFSCTTDAHISQKKNPMRSTHIWNWNKKVKRKRIVEKSSGRDRCGKRYVCKKSANLWCSVTKWEDAAQGYSHNHAEHHEDIPQGNEDSEIPETQQELSDIVT